VGEARKRSRLAQAKYSLKRGGKRGKGGETLDQVGGGKEKRVEQERKRGKKGGFLPCSPRERGPTSLVVLGQGGRKKKKDCGFEGGKKKLASAGNPTRPQGGRGPDANSVTLLPVLMGGGEKRKKKKEGGSCRAPVH